MASTRSHCRRSPDGRNPQRHPGLACPRACRQRESDVIILPCADLRAAKGDGWHSRLHRGCAGYLAYALEQSHHYQLIFGNIPIDEPDDELEAAADNGKLAIRELIEHARAVGELDAAPPRELATVVWVLLHGLGQLQITDHLHEPPRSTATPESTTYSSTRSPHATARAARARATPRYPRFAPRGTGRTSVATHADRTRAITDLRLMTGGNCHH